MKHVKNKNNSVGLVIQTVLSVAIVMFAIFYFFEPNVLVILESLTALFMLVMAYNNHVTFKRKNWYTIAYIVIAVLIIISIIF